MQALYGNELNQLYVDKFREIYQENRSRIFSIKTKSAAQQYIREIREKVRSCFQFPKTKCPLNPVITGKLSGDSCNMEKLYFFSRPGYPVTANFYLPKKFRGKLPTVLFLCGHSVIGKSSDTYQTACISLAQKGFAVLAIDPMGQGERVSLWGKNLPGFPVPTPCQEHNSEGKQLFLCGEWFGAWRAYDGIRAVDYLLTRPEVDPKRIGVTGNSGGGTLTTWLNAVEDRLCMAAPSCYITTWKNNVENELPADIEQMPPAAAALGLEMSDFLLAAAPRPLLILGQRNDFFDHRGTKDTFQAVKHLYDLLGARVEHFIGPDNHGYFEQNRKAMYRFFTELALGKISGDENKIRTFTREETWAAPAGDIANIPENRTFRELAAELADGIVAKRKSFSPAACRKKLEELLKPGKTFLPEYRILRPRAPFSRFALETEPGKITSILKRKADSVFFHLEPNRKKILLYVPHLDSQDEMKDRQFPAKYDAVYGIDIRGVGEMTPSGCDQPEIREFFKLYEWDYHYAALSSMLDEPMLGRRTHDILCAAELLAQDGAEIELEAKGQGCVPALMAAVFSDKIKKLRLIDGLDSYYSLTQMPSTWWPYAVFLPGILRHFDLKEIRQLVAKKLL